MKNKKSPVERFIAPVEAEKEAEVAPFQKEDLGPGLPGRAITPAERTAAAQAAARYHPGPHAQDIIMIGPTGVGKTEIARRLAKLTNSPFLKVEASGSLPR